jgi:hypothetical protein
LTVWTQFPKFNPISRKKLGITDKQRPICFIKTLANVNDSNEGKSMYMTVELAMKLLMSEGVYLTPEGKEHLVRLLNDEEVTSAK